MMKVLVVHQTALIANIIASFLADHENITVIGFSSNYENALAQVEEKGCDLVLVSATLPEQGALALTRSLAEGEPQVKVLVIGLPESEHIILQYVMAGAAGYVLQDVSEEALLENVRAVHEDKAIISPRIAGALMLHLSELASISTRQDLDVSMVEVLTPREQEVLTLIGKGMTNREIARKLVIETGTVKNHVHNLLKKLDVRSREDAAAFVPYLGDEGEG
jgi:DNA-binding NarL/FixJ family response regulator